MRGLVPRWGRGGAWRNPPCQFAVPNHNSGFSHLGVPAPPGTSDSYENDATQPQERLNATAPALVSPAPQIVIPAKSLPRTPIRGRNPEGRWEVRPPPVLVRKHVPDYDPGCALQSTSMPALHRRNVPNCRPMADGGMRKCSAGACPPLGLGVGRGGIRRANSLYQTTTPSFHTSVCRHQPARAIGTKACPGLRSGMNGTRHDRRSRHAGVRWNPLALVMPAPQSSFPRRACPVPRYGAGIQRGGGEARPPPVLVRKHVPDYDPGCALQSTSMPALRRRNLPNCRPMAEGGMRKCSAGGLSPAGVGVGRGGIHRTD